MLANQKVTLNKTSTCTLSLKLFERQKRYSVEEAGGTREGSGGEGGKGGKRKRQLVKTSEVAASRERYSVKNA